MIRATLVLLVAYLIVPRLPRRSAAERHLLWVASLWTSAMLPVLGLLVPAWQPEWMNLLAEAWPASLVALGPWASGQGPDVIVRATGIEPAAWAWSDWVGALWVIGAAVALVAMGTEVVKLARLVSVAVPVTDGRCGQIARDTARALRLSRVPALLLSTRAVIPMTWGVRRPQVLLPACSVDWSDERLRAVLAHELAHIRRGDWLVHVLAQVACAAYWFHPLFWMAERGLCRESEQAADDVVLRLGIEGTSYAAHLLAIVRAIRVPVSSRAPSVAMVRRTHLEHRVAALLKAHVNRRSVTRRATMVAAAIGAVAAVPLAAMTMRAGTIDVDIRTVNLPAAVSASLSPGPVPVLPAVRYVRTTGVASNGGRAVVPPAIAEYTTPPLYSEQARRRGVEGIVTIGVHVDESGRLIRADVLKGLGFGLDQNALVALRQWRFRPGTSSGRSVAMDAEIDFEFNLRSEAVNELIANDMATLVGPGITPPRVVRTSRLPAPTVSPRGSVVLDVVLLEDGSPKIVRILQSLSPAADESAVRHFEQWRFSPAMKSGVPVKVRMNAEVRFHG